jgi:tetratricopeptide (TPR) repeat protein
MTETTTLTPNELFDNAIKDYQAGESPAKLIPIFIDICNRSPKLDSAWTCLAWLYLLEDKPQLAIKAAQKSMKIDPFDAQTRINLAAAMLEIKQSGVREHIEMAKSLVEAAPEVHEQVVANFQDGFNRKPDWASLKRIKKLIFED